MEDTRSYENRTIRNVCINDDHYENWLKVSFHKLTERSREREGGG